MNRFVVLVVPLLLVCGFAAAAQATVFSCTVADSRRLDPQGKLVMGEGTATGDRPLGHFTFNDRTGRFYGYGDPWVLSIIQRGSREHVLLAISTHVGPGNTAIQMLKINTFNTGRMPFLWLNDDELASGVCTAGE
ncbi:hypothetical protein L2D14_10465 [Thalassospiraceae bacterium LMO-JJ14]|nr:hypothetical protein L2D14_10465 [Thalassospiraceae bacterium LMO-JJ14]